VVDALLTLPDTASLGRAYGQLSPQTYADNQIADFYSGLRFADSLMSCSAPDGRYAFIKEGQCVWAQLGGGFLDLAATGGNLGFRESAVRISGGAEIMLQPDWFAGLALGYEHGDESTSDGSAKSQADRGRAGAVIKYNSGPYLFAAAVYGGYGWYTTDRFMDFGGFNATAGADSRVGVVGGRLRAAYLVDKESWYLKPLLDLNVTHIGLNGFAEHGAGGANLIVSGNDQTVFSGSPAIEVGAQWALQEGIFLRPFARVGVTAYSNTSFAASALFAGAPASVAPFQVTSGIDTVTADVAIGADLLTNERWGLKLAYNGHYGARVRSTDFSLKASLRF
jgi:outer membrane autotransporter protein